jgi:hypothetical protein
LQKSQIYVIVGFSQLLIEMIKKENSMQNPLAGSNLSKLRALFEKNGKGDTVADVLLRIQDLFPQLESAYEEYLEDEAADDSQYKIQEKISDLAIAAQTILLILESENPDWAPSPSLDNAISTRLTEHLATQSKNQKGG